MSYDKRESAMNVSDAYAYFYNSDKGDRLYNADSMTDWLYPFFTTGVFNGGLQVLQNEEPNIGVYVDTGYVNIEGKTKHYISQTPLTFDIPHSMYPRIDTIVVRRNDLPDVRDFEIAVVTGEAARNPVPTPPVRTETIYELVLAEVFVKAGEIEITQAEITDKRADSDVCGWVTATVDEIPFDQFAAQFASYFQQFKDGNEADFLEWFANLKYVLDGDVAGHLQNEIDELSGGGTLFIDSENYISIDYSKVKKEE